MRRTRSRSVALADTVHPLWYAGSSVPPFFNGLSQHYVSAWVLRQRSASCQVAADLEHCHLSALFFRDGGRNGRAVRSLRLDTGTCVGPLCGVAISHIHVSSCPV